MTTLFYHLLGVVQLSLVGLLICAVVLAVYWLSGLFGPRMKETNHQHIEGDEYDTD